LHRGGEARAERWAGAISAWCQGSLRRSIALPFPLD
jgi:hypothetical protein